MKTGIICLLSNFMKPYYNDSYDVLQAGEALMDVFIILDSKVGGRAFVDNREKGRCGL
jgi:hypothetical protein